MSNKISNVVLDALWYNGCGIVKVQTEYDGIKYYIRGVCSQTTEEHDSQIIGDWGSTFPNDVGDLLFKQYGRG